MIFKGTIQKIVNYILKYDENKILLQIFKVVLKPEDIFMNQSWRNRERLEGRDELRFFKQNCYILYYKEKDICVISCYILSFGMSVLRKLKS